MPRVVAGLTLAFVASVSALLGGLAANGGVVQLGPKGMPSVPSFADIVARVNPSVVHVDVLDPSADPHDESEGQAPEPDVPQRGEGSGFVIDGDGHILTNHHLVAGAARIRVRLADKRELPARLIGSDPNTDLALLRTEVRSDLQPVALGDSDALRVGDWVCAIGNPLSFDHSVTCGVVSSKGRKIWDQSFDAFIQTDAAINPGNSGGPLLNLAGQAVGINAAVSREGQGIGFAIPINVARDVLDQLKRYGRVTRGFLGVQLEELDPDLERLLGLKEARGAVVADVVGGGPGDGAGLRRYDVITGVADRPVADGDQVVRAISARAPGSTVALTVVRDGREVHLLATLTERAPDQPEPSPSPARAERPASDALGLSISELAPGDREQLHVPADRLGVVVDEVLAWSPEADRLEQGDLVVEVNRRPTPDVGAYRRVLASLAPGAKAVLFVYRPRPASSFLARLEVEPK